MVLQKWSPFSEFRHMHDSMNRMRHGSGWREGSNGVDSWALPLDVVQEGDNIVVHASMPGVEPENIDVTIENDVLTIKGETKIETEQKEGSYMLRERRTGAFRRSLRLPDTVDTDKAETKYENCILTVTISKVEAKKAKKLEVKAS